MQLIDHTAADHRRVRKERILVARSGFSETAWTMMAFLSHHAGSLTQPLDTPTYIRKRLSKTGMRWTETNASGRDWSSESMLRGPVGPTTASR